MESSTIEEVKRSKRWWKDYTLSISSGKLISWSVLVNRAITLKYSRRLVSPINNRLRDKGDNSEEQSGSNLQ